MTANNLQKHAGEHSLNWISHSHNAAAIANFCCIKASLSFPEEKSNIRISAAKQRNV